jgi:hypothetical protein
MIFAIMDVKFQNLFLNVLTNDFKLVFSGNRGSENQQRHPVQTAAALRQW